jgi:putative toxin-antitoxin system antitoxin component (TIGR02293 family)
MGKEYRASSEGSFMAEDEFVPYLSSSSTTGYIFWDDLKVIREIALKGLRGEFFSSLKKRFGLNNKQFSEFVGVTWKTITNHKRDQAIQGLFTERALYLAKVWDAGIYYFNDPIAVRNWLSKQNPFFDNESPINLLNTHAGCELVYNKLRQMAFGITA